MKSKYVVTFEFDEAKPETVRGTVEAVSVEKMAWRALREAREQKPNMRWSSIVCVLERLG